MSIDNSELPLHSTQDKTNTITSLSDNFPSLLVKFYIHIKNNQLDEAEQVRTQLDIQKADVKDQKLVYKYEIFNVNWLIKKKQFGLAEKELARLETEVDTFDKELRFYFYLNKGRLLFYLNRFDEAIIIYQQAEKNIVPLIEEVASLYYNLAASSTMQLNLYKAIDYVETAYRCYKQIGNLKEICRCHLLRGSCYSRMNDYKKSEEYNIKSIMLSEKINDDELIGIAYHNLAVLSSKQEEYSKSIEYYQKSIEIAEKNNRTEYKVKTIISIARLQYKLGNNVKALEYIHDGLTICSIYEDKSVSKDLENELNTIYFFINDMSIEYENTLIDSIRTYNERKLWSKVSSCAEDLSGFYMKQQNYSKAIESLKVAYDAKRKIGKS